MLLSNLFLPDNLYLQHRCFLEDKYFMVQQGTDLSNSKENLSGVPQGSLLFPMLYNAYNFDLLLTDVTSSNVHF